MDYLVEDALILGIVSFFGWYIRQQFIKASKRWEKTEEKLMELDKSVHVLEDRTKND